MMNLKRDKWVRENVVVVSQSIKDKLMKKTLKKKRRVKQQKMKRRKKLKQN